MENKKIILLASERSGTNLLRTLLNNHQDISGPVAPHFFDAFNSTLKYYGDLNNKKNKLLLLNHMIRLANHSYHDWKLNVTEEDLSNAYQITSIETAFDTLYSAKANQDGKVHYVSKDNHLFNYTNHLDKLDTIKYIYLYRDPRDHVASWMRTPLFMHTPYDVILKWKREQEKILKIAKKHKVHFISYEDLISNTPRSMAALLNFLEISVDEKCFATNPFNEESKRNEFWKNLSKPILKENKKKYLKTLSKRDISIIESKVKDIMLKLDYDLDSSGTWKPYKGFGYELKMKRSLSKFRHKKLFHNKMADLQDKLQLIKTFAKEVKS